MSRHDAQRLEDIRAACAAIREHLTHGDLDQGLIFDAVRVRLIEIGEAVKALDPALLATEPGIPWRQIIGMRDQLAHRYFDTSHAIVAGTVQQDLPQAGSRRRPACGHGRQRQRELTAQRPHRMGIRHPRRAPHCPRHTQQGEVHSFTAGDTEDRFICP